MPGSVGAGPGGQCGAPAERGRSPGRRESGGRPGRRGAPGRAAAARPDLSATAAARGRPWLGCVQPPGSAPPARALVGCQRRTRPGCRGASAHRSIYGAGESSVSLSAPELLWREVHGSASPCCVSWRAWPDPAWGVPTLKWSTYPLPWLGTYVALLSTGRCSPGL